MHVVAVTDTVCNCSNWSSCVFAGCEVWSIEMLLKMSDIKLQELHQCPWGDMLVLQECQECVSLIKVARSLWREYWRSASGQWTTERLNKVKRSLLSFPQNTAARSADQ